MQDEKIRIIVYNASREGDFQSFLNLNTDIEELEVVTLVDGDVIRYGNVGSKKDKLFTNFKKKNKLQKHFGGPYSAHNQAWKKCEALKNQKQHLDSFFARRSEKVSKLLECIS